MQNLIAASLAALFIVSCTSHRAAKKPVAQAAEAAPKPPAQPVAPAWVETRKFPAVPHDDWEVILPNDPKSVLKGIPCLIFVNTATKASVQVFEFQFKDGSTVIIAERLRQTLKTNGYAVGDLESSDAMPGQPSLFTFTKTNDDEALAGQIVAMSLHRQPDVQFAFIAIWPEAVTAEMTNDLYWIAQHFQVRVGGETNPPPARAPLPGRSKGTTAVGPKPQGAGQ